jgi:hypothetical protein
MIRFGQWLLGIPILLAACDASPDQPLPLGRPASMSGYFPQILHSINVPCEGDLWEHEPVLSEESDRWNASFLRAAQEPPLYTSSAPSAVDGVSALRCIWLPTFHAPVIIRIEFMQDRPNRLIAIQLAGRGGYEPGVIARTASRNLTQRETQQLENLFAANRLFDRPMAECDLLSVDGAQWIFEYVDKNGYRFLRRHSPANGVPREVGDFMLQLTGWRFDEIY